MITKLTEHSEEFPHASNANDEGILAFGGDLYPSRVMNAYNNGIFPWYNKEEPILWWSPDPRFILDPSDLHISKTLKKTLKKEIFEIKFDTSFLEVIKNCANTYRPNQNSTWIHPNMIHTYNKLHQQGYAHSFEAWFDGELVGGGYGIVVGDIFCGESMFSLVADASKVAFVHLITRLKNNGFTLIDSQIYSEHLENFGAKYISREIYLQKVKESSKKHINF